MMIGVCFALGLMHFAIWARRHDADHLRFLLVSIVAFAVSTFGYVELRLMTAQSVSEAIPYLHLGHAVLFVVFIALAMFVHEHFGTGRLWLLWIVVAARVAVLVADFASDVNIHYLAVHSLRTATALGETITVVGEAVANPWSRLAPATALLFLAYVIDASVALWRKSGSVLRWRTLLVGGSIVLTVVAAAGVSVLKHEGILDWPYIVTPSFLLVAIAIGYELTKDVLRSDELAARLLANRAELSISEQRLQMSARAAGIGIWEWDMASDTVNVSELGLSILGLPPPETMTATSFFDRLLPEDQVAVRSAVAHAAANAGEFDIWVRIRGEVRRPRCIALRGAVQSAGPAQAGMVRGVLLDVTERHDADERVRLIAETSPIGVLMVDAAGRIMFANRHLDEIFGYGRGELVGKPVDHLVPQTVQDRHRTMREGFTSGARAMLQGRDVVGLCKDGSTNIVEVWLATVRIQDESVTIASVIENTGRRAMEFELGKRREEIAHMSRVAMLGELSGSLAHELNQPLTAILSNAQACQQLTTQERLAPATLNEILQDIVNDTRRAGEVIKRLRTLLRRGELVMERIELNTIVLEVLRLIGSELIDRRVSVTTELAQNLAPVLGDRVQLQQVV
jgi:PAS domain S-box-containing protein